MLMDIVEVIKKINTNIGQCKMVLDTDPFDTETKSAMDAYIDCKRMLREVIRVEANDQSKQHASEPE